MYFSPKTVRCARRVQSALAARVTPKTVRFARRTLLAGATVATVLAVVVTFENWRGARAWRRYREAAAARGDPVDVFPRPSPLRPERNFFATPAIDRWLLQSDAASRSRTEAHLRNLKVEWSTAISTGSWREGAAVDLAPLEKWRKARKTPAPKEEGPAGLALRELLVPAEALLAEMRDAAVRCPDSELQLPPWRPGEDLITRPIPSFQLCRAYAAALVLDARLALDDGATDRAFADTLAAMQLGRGLLAQRDATLVGAMIGCVVLDRALQSFWEGVQRHAWSDAQLAEFDRVLADCRALDAFERSMRGERTFLALIELRGPSAAGLLSAWNWSGWFSGWRDQNRLSCCQALEPQLAALAARDTAGFLAAIARRDREIETFFASASPYRWLARMAIPSLDKTTERSAGMEAFVRAARVAGALERHRLAHGAIPAALAELAPRYLAAVPLDPVDGQPLRYVRQEDETFLLYSIALDGRDDRGTPVKTKRGSNEPPTGDWSWPQLRAPAAPAKP